MLEFDLDNHMRWFLWVSCPHQGKRRWPQCGGVNFQKADFDEVRAHVAKANRERAEELTGLRVLVAALRNTITSMKKEKEK